VMDETYHPPEKAFLRFQAFKINDAGDATHGKIKMENAKCKMQNARSKMQRAK
jgi:hypothetical protein